MARIVSWPAAALYLVLFGSAFLVFCVMKALICLPILLPHPLLRLCRHPGTVPLAKRVWRSGWKPDAIIHP